MRRYMLFREIEFKISTTILKKKEILKHKLCPRSLMVCFLLALSSDERIWPVGSRASCTVSDISRVSFAEAYQVSKLELFWVLASGSWSFWALPSPTALTGDFSPQCPLWCSSGSYLWYWFQAEAPYLPSFQQAQYWWFLWPRSRLMSPENYLTYLLLPQIDYARENFICTQPSCITSPFIDTLHSYTIKEKVYYPSIFHICPFIHSFFY